MFGWLKKQSKAAVDEPRVVVFINPLVMILGAAEDSRGRPLTREEVLEIRDNSPCILMTESQARKYYAALDAQMPMLRLDPERVWEEWQIAREHPAPLNARKTES